MTGSHTTVHIPDEAVQAAIDAWLPKFPSPTHYEMRNSLAAALPYLSAPCAVEVRRLEWEGCNHSIKAKTILGEYNVDKFAEKYRFYHLGGSTYQWHDTLDQAKAAAQDDFERRILSCVVTKTVDVAAARRQAFEEACIELEVNWPHIATPEIRDAIRSLSAEPAQCDQWQPIETAPKDGTPFLVFVPDDKFSDRSGIDVIWYDEEQWLFGSNTPFIPANNPTHWMPLPAATTTEAGK